MTNLFISMSLSTTKLLCTHWHFLIKKKPNETIRVDGRWWTDTHELLLELFGIYRVAHFICAALSTIYFITYSILWQPHFALCFCSSIHSCVMRWQCACVRLAFVLAVFYLCVILTVDKRHLGCYTQFCCAQHTTMAMMSWTRPFTYIPSHGSDSLWHVFPSGLRMNPSLHLHMHESPALTNSCSQPCFPSAQGSSSAGAIRREIKLLNLLGVITAVVAPLPPTVYLCAVTSV